MMAHGKMESWLTCNGQAAHLGADYSLIFCTSVVISSFFISALLFFNVLLSYLYIRHAGSGKSFIFFKNFQKNFFAIWILSLCIIFILIIYHFNLKHNKNITTATLETLCDILSCTPNDIIGMSHNVSRYLW